MKTIAVIEDDQHIGNILENALKKEGYEILRAYSGTEAVYLLSHNTPDLIILDLMLPGLSGEEILPKMTGIPVIIVSAKVGVDDKVNLLLSGAVDYITKPFEIRELLARIAVQFRKENRQNLATVLKVDNLTLDLSSHEVVANDVSVHLTKTEYAILKLLMQNPNQVISKTVILEKIFEDTPDCTDRSLKQHISNLRKKLRDAGNKEHIEAVWGIGFKMKF